jgi:hypothetical protein
VAGCSIAVVTTRVRSRRSLGDAADREVVGLGAAGGEHELAGVAGEERGDLAAGALDRLAGAAAVDVAARGVAEVRAQVREHGVDDLGQAAGWWRCGRGRSGRHEGEALHPAHGRGVVVRQRLGEGEGRAQGRDEAGRVVAHHVEAAAPRGAVGGEGADEDAPARRDGALQHVDVGGPVGGLGEEMKHGPVVPEGVARGGREAG